MRLISAFALAAFVLGLSPSAVRADIPPARDVKFTVEVDENAKAPKLVVPSSMTRVQFRPRDPVPDRGPKTLPAGKEVGYLEVESDEEVAPAGRNPNHLMIAGVALSLALGLGGVWMVRRQGGAANRGLVLLLAAGATLTASTIAWANVAPAAPPPPKEKVVLPVAFEGNVNLEVTVAGDTIRLILDKDTYEKMKKDPEGSK